MQIYWKINFSNSMVFLFNCFELEGKVFKYLEQTSNLYGMKYLAFIAFFIATLFNNPFAKRAIFANTRFDNKVQFNHSKICLFIAWYARKNIYDYKPIQRRDVQVKRLVAIR